MNRDFDFVLENGGAKEGQKSLSPGKILNPQMVLL